MLDQIQAVLFDLDGTLMDSMWVWVDVDEAYIKQYHLNPPEDFYQKMEGMSYTETAAYYLRTFPEIQKTVEEIKDEWYAMTLKRYMYEVELKPGLVPFLQELQARGIRMGIATSNTRELVEQALQAHGISSYFDTVSTSCEAGAGKPAPDVYLNAAGMLQIPPEKCLVFEDVPMGILAGRRAGMRVCAVDDSFSAAQEEKKRALA
ncbi:MAG TPA: HAD family hydrolase, partial [Lachnospiraceae bacterium]|nr:HAD family hydrolase [Lachnospiraceae bacterium]